MYFTFIILLVNASLLFVNALHAPKYLHPCQKNDRNLKSCAIKSAQEVIANIKNGDRKYGIPSLTPLKIPYLEIVGNNLKLKFNDVEAIGFENTIVDDIQIDDSGMTLKINCTSLQFLSNFEAKGKLLVVAVEGTGRSNVTVENVHAIYDVVWKSIEENNIIHRKITHSELHFNLTHAYYDLDGNLFNGDPLLIKNLNIILNENWNEILNDLGPSINSMIIEIINTVTAAYLKNIPENELFLD